MLFNSLKRKNLNFTNNNFERGLSKKQLFDNIIKAAQKVIDTSKNFDKENHPICDMIRLLGRKLQSTEMEYLFWYGDVDSKLPDLNPENIFFPSNVLLDKDDINRIITFHSLRNEVQCDKYINLSTDLILPWPWHKERLLDSLKNIGNGRVSGIWKQDESNHNVTVWLPMGICWVHGGNHSITIGIVQGGSLKPNYWYNISAIYKYVKTDGNYFYRISDNKKLYPVQNVEFAAIFEIGKMMYENNICFKGLHLD